MATLCGLLILSLLHRLASGFVMLSSLVAYARHPMLLHLLFLHIVLSGAPDTLFLINPLRQEPERICHAVPEWDGRVCSQQVTDTSERVMQVRVLASADDAGKVRDLRCRVGEGLVHFILQNHADCLPRLRATVDNFSDGSRVLPEVGQ